MASCAPIGNRRIARLVKKKGDSMRIGIVGVGHLGATIARLLTKAGHEVALNNSRGPESLALLVQELGPAARAVTFDAAARYGDVIVLAIPWTSRETLSDPRLFAHKILIDAMNPFSARFEVLDLGQSTSSELVAQQFPHARVVKAFNTLYWETLATRGTKHVAHRFILPLASDDLAAKATVSGLISDCGFAPFDVGTLRDGGEWQQPKKLLFNRPLTLREAEQLLTSR
jgi:predicted dinucleotide-binding enzyme